MTKPFARGAGIACLVAALAGCSSGGSHTASSTSTKVTTTTSKTPTSYPNTDAGVRAFFAHDGKLLLDFERATKALATGSLPPRATCLHLTNDVLPKIVSDPNKVFPLTQRIPDPTLAAAFGQDVRIKVLVALGCRGATGSVSPAETDPRAYPTVRAFAENVKRLLARYGITV